MPFSCREGPHDPIVHGGAAIGTRRLAPTSKLETETNHPVSFLSLKFPALLRACFFLPLLLLFNENTLQTQLLLPKKSSRVLLSPSPSLLRKSTAGRWSQR